MSSNNVIELWDEEKFYEATDRLAENRGGPYPIAGKVLSLKYRLKSIPVPEAPMTAYEREKKAAVERLERTKRLAKKVKNKTDGERRW